MEPREMLNALAIVEMLKDTTRHCYTSKGRHESVTEHSWMMTVMAFLMINEFPEANMNKVIQMCIIHDLGECFTGDIPVFMKNKENENVEERLLNEWVESLPKVTRNLMKESIWKRRKDRLLNQKYIRQ